MQWAPATQYIAFPGDGKVFWQSSSAGMVKGQVWLAVVRPTSATVDSKEPHKPSALRACWKQLPLGDSSAYRSFSDAGILAGNTPYVTSPTTYGNNPHCRIRGLIVIYQSQPSGRQLPPKPRATLFHKSILASRLVYILAREQRGPSWSPRSRCAAAGTLSVAVTVRGARRCAPPQSWGRRGTKTSTRWTRISPSLHILMKMTQDWTVQAGTWRRVQNKPRMLGGFHQTR